MCAELWQLVRQFVALGRDAGRGMLGVVLTWCRGFVEKMGKLGFLRLWRCAGILGAGGASYPC